MAKTRFAKLLSIILGPQVWLPLIIVTLVFKTGLRTDQIIRLFPVLFILQVVVPLFYLYIAVNRRWVSAWDLPKRNERYPFFIIATLSSLASLLAVANFGNLLLLYLTVIVLASIFAIGLITLVWKISIHMTLNVIGCVFLNLLFHNTLLYLYFSIPLIFWSRLYLKRHTPLQLIAALILQIIIISFTWNYFQINELIK